VRRREDVLKANGITKDLKDNKSIQGKWEWLVNESSKKECKNDVS